jgi:hypothetical protein
LEEIVAALVKKTENTTGGIRCGDHATPSIRKSWYYFAKKRRSLGRHSSLADQSHGVFSPPYIIRNFGKPNALLDTCFTVVSCLAYSWTLKMDATCSSETLAAFQWTTWRYIPDDSTLQQHDQFSLSMLFLCR